MDVLDRLDAHATARLLARHGEAGGDPEAALLARRRSHLATAGIVAAALGLAAGALAVGGGDDARVGAAAAAPLEHRLLDAIDAGDHGAIRALIRAGADVDHVVASGDPVLVVAVRTCDPVAVTLVNAARTVHSPPVSPDRLDAALRSCPAEDRPALRRVVGAPPPPEPDAFGIR